MLVNFLLYLTSGHQFIKIRKKTVNLSLSEAHQKRGPIQPPFLLAGFSEEIGEFFCFMGISGHTASNRTAG